MPKARLVIHKMVLVNFKSYAGKQGIGPFHEVCQHVRNRRFRQSLVPIVQENRTHRCVVLASRASSQGTVSVLIHHQRRVDGALLGWVSQSKRD